MNRALWYRKALHTHPLCLYGLTCLTGFIIIGAWFFLWYAPLADTLARLRISTVAHERNVIKSGHGKNVQLSKEQLEQSLHSFATYQEKMPLEKALYSLIDALTDFATQAGVTLYSCTLGHEHKEEWYIQVPLKLMIAGSQHEIVSFFCAIAQSSRLITIQEVDMAHTGTKGFDVLITLKAYLILP